MNIEQIARICHEVNRAYCAGLGDHSQPAWDDAPQWQRESAMNGVRHIINHPDTTPEDSHRHWMAEKVATGWTYGPVKDPDLKQHPCMVPYNDLPPEQRMKDHLFIDVVRAALKENSDE